MTCIPFETTEVFPTKHAFVEAVNARGAENVRICGETPFAQRLVNELGIATVADLTQVPCHVIHQDDVIGFPHKWTAVVKFHADGTIRADQPVHEH
jgi:hypothetical protein